MEGVAGISYKKEYVVGLVYYTLKSESQANGRLLTNRE